MTKKDVEVSKKSKSDGQLTDQTDAGFWLDWLSQKEIDELPGERKKPVKVSSIRDKYREKTR